MLKRSENENSDEKQFVSNEKDSILLHRFNVDDCRYFALQKYGQIF